MIMFHQPRTLDEALNLKRRLGDAACFIAGGTDLVVLMNRRAFSRDKDLIDLGRLPGADALVSATDAGGVPWYELGPLVTFAQLARIPVACLADAARSVGGAQIRQRATLTGNLATASPAADGATALMTLDAELTLASSGGSRVVPLEQFFLAYRKTALAPDEMIVSVRFRVPETSGWHKLGRRGAMNIALASCAVARGHDGAFAVAFGSLAPFPVSARRTAACLTARYAPGRTFDEASLDEACRLATDEVQPIGDMRASAGYRRAMAGVLLRKVLRQMGLVPDCPGQG